MFININIVAAFSISQHNKLCSIVKVCVRACVCLSIYVGFLLEVPPLTYTYVFTSLPQRCEMFVLFRLHALSTGIAVISSILKLLSVFLCNVNCYSV